jgi:hypothetical protein
LRDCFKHFPPSNLVFIAVQVHSAALQRRSQSIPP